MYLYIRVSACCEGKPQPTYNDPPATTAGGSLSKANNSHRSCTPTIPTTSVSSPHNTHQRPRASPMNIDMDAPTETEADTFDAVLADINHINRLTADEIEDYSMGACLLLNHHPFSELRQHWADNPTDNETTWTLYGTIIAASTMDPHLDADALARFYQLPRTTIDEATAL